MGFSEYFRVSGKTTYSNYSADPSHPPNPLAYFLAARLAFFSTAISTCLVEFLKEIGLAERVQFECDWVWATYGHSTKQFAPSTSAIPDQPLLHGTSANNWAMIECFGL
jgi:hypothetical protein